MAKTKIEGGKSSEHADFSNGWVEIFRAGNYKPQNGWDGSATPADLQRVASSYDPEFHEAPACIGHPKADLPAYAWVDRVKTDGDTLLAKFKEVDPTFESLVKSGKFKKRSAAFYLDANGKMSGLRHVGFLGAQPPEVKGLKNLNFDDHSQNFTDVEFGEEDSMAAETQEKTIGEQIAAYFAEKFGKKQDGGAATFSEADVKRIAAEAATAAAKPLTEKIATLETNLQSQTAKFTEREQAIATSETRQRATEAVTKLKGAGKWVPAFEKQGLPAVFDELAKVTTTIEFGEGDAKKKVTPLEVLVQFMEGLPKIVPDGRVFTGGASAKLGAGTGDPLTDAAKVLQREKKITFSEAIDQVAAEHPEWTVPGAAHAGAV